MSTLDRQRRVARRIAQPGNPYSIRGRSDQARTNRHIAGATALGIVGAAGLLALKKGKPGFISLFRNTAGVSGRRYSKPVGNELFWVRQQTPIWTTRNGRRIRLGELWGRKAPITEENPTGYEIHRVPIQTRARRYASMKLNRAYVRRAKRATFWKVLGYDETWKAADDLANLAKDKVKPIFIRTNQWVDNFMAGKAPKPENVRFPPIWAARRYATGTARRIEKTANRYNRKFQHQRNRIARAVKAGNLPTWPTLATGVAVAGASGATMAHLVRQDRKYGAYREPILSAGLTPDQSRLVVDNGKFLHDRLVHSVAKKFAQTGMPYDDIVQAGRLGLVNAAKKYDPQRGAKFSTYAVPWIRSAIQRERGRDFPIRLPERQIGRAAAPNIAPLEALANVGDESYVLSPGLNQRDAQRQLRQMMGRLQVLTPQQQRVMRERYFTGQQQQSVQAIARKLGMTPGRVSQLESAARKRLQRMSVS